MCYQARQCSGTRTWPNNTCTVAPWPNNTCTIRKKKSCPFLLFLGGGSIILVHYIAFSSGNLKFWGGGEYMYVRYTIILGWW